MRLEKKAIYILILIIFSFHPIPINPQNLILINCFIITHLSPNLNPNRFLILHLHLIIALNFILNLMSFIIPLLPIQIFMISLQIRSYKK